MKRLFAAALFVLGGMAEGVAWDVERFDTVIRVQPDSSLEITERIVADFHGDPHHGIFRTDRKSTRLNSSHLKLSRMPSSA